MAGFDSLGIVAAAGTGKTYQLAQRFLALLALDGLPQAGDQAVRIGPESMVALTFTKKAAREFASRIVRDLALAAGGSGSSAATAKLAQRIGEVWRGGMVDPGYGQLPALLGGGEGAKWAPLEQADFRRMLRRVTDDLDRLELTTLDAFFVRIARSFALELGLAGFELLDEAGLARRRAQVLTELFARHPRLEMDAAHDGFAASIQRANFGREQTAWSATIQQLLDDFGDVWLKHPQLASWRAPEFEEKELSPQEMAAILAELRRQLAETLGEELPVAVVKGIRDLLDWLETGGRVAPPTNATAKAIFAEQGLGGGDFRFVFNRRERRLPAEFAAGLARLLDHALALSLRVAGERARGLGELLQRYDETYSARVRQRGELSFNELSALLANRPLLGEAAAERFELTALRLAERLDARIDHWFLDEFQDTSRTQFEVLRPLLDEVIQSTEGTRSLFVVGDPKQAIYGWRGGEAELFEELWQQPGWEQRLGRWGMSQSFRSAQPVLDFVNAVCGGDGLAQLEGVDGELLARWQFAEHRSAAVYPVGHACAGQPLAGFAALWELPKASGRGALAQEADGEGSEENEEEGGLDAEDPRWQLAAQLIAQADLAARGLRAVVLVRRGKSANAAGQALRQLLPKQGVDLAVEIEGEVLLASDSPLGLVLADVFLWLEHPGDRLALGHWRSSLLGGRWRELGEEALWARLWKIWAEAGPVGLLEELLQGLTVADWGEYQDGRLRAWRGLAARWMQEGGGSLADWRRVLEHARQRELGAGAVVQVMTVHKAKGLEWDLVIDAEPGNRYQGWVSRRRLNLLEGADRHGEEFVVPMPPSWVVDRQPELAAAARDWERRQVYEGLCVGYVAWTRARHALHVLVEPLSKDAEKKGLQRRGDHWLRAGLSCLEPAEGGEEPVILRQFGRADWFADYRRGEASERASKATLRLGPVVPRLRRRLPSARPEGRKSAGVPEVATRFGSLVHAAAARLPLAGVEVDWAAIPARDEESRRAVELVQGAWSQPELAWAWGEAGWEIWTERGFEIVLGDEWISGVFDRVLLERGEDGRVVSARLVEIKTDAVADELALRLRHQRQLGIYRQVLARLAGLDERTVTARWLWLPPARPGQLVELGDVR